MKTLFFIFLTIGVNCYAQVSVQSDNSYINKIANPIFQYKNDSITFVISNLDEAKKFQVMTFMGTEELKINNAKYAAFGLSYTANDTIGYIRIINDSIFFLSRNHEGSKDCSQDQLVCTFLAKPGESWKTLCMGILSYSTIKSNGNYYDQLLKDSVYCFSVIPNFDYTGNLSLSEFKVSKKYGFIEFTRAFRSAIEDTKVFWVKTLYYPILYKDK